MTTPYQTTACRTTLVAPPLTLTATCSGPLHLRLTSGCPSTANAHPSLFSPSNDAALDRTLTIRTKAEVAPHARSNAVATSLPSAEGDSCSMLLPHSVTARLRA